jgi:hypothetical protein
MSFFEHNLLYWLCKYFICFFNIYFPKYLGFVIRKLHFLVMDNKIIHAACMGAAVTMIATGIAII